MLTGELARGSSLKVSDCHPASAGWSPSTIFQALQLRAREHGDLPAFGEWIGDDIHLFTFKDFLEEVSRAASILGGLAPAGPTRIGILLKTSLAFEVAHFGLLSMKGAVVIGLDPRDSDVALSSIIVSAQITGLITADLGEVARLTPKARSCLRFVIAAPTASTEDWRGVLVKGPILEPTPLVADGPTPPPAEPDDLATIVFTSGSSGEPKGYGYRHDQLMYAANGCRELLPCLATGSRLLAWLPLSALFQRMINWVGVIAGATTYFAPDPTQAAKRAREINPTVFFGVPRFYQKLRTSILEHADRCPAPQRWLIHAALAVSRARGRAAREGRTHLFADIAAHSVLAPTLTRLRTILGTDLQAAVTGSAPIPLDVVDELEGLGIRVLEAYGLTECVAPVAMNTLSRRRAGTVGLPLRSQDVRLGDDGEIEVRGPGLPCLTLGEAPSFSPDGFLRTGDVGAFDDSGFLRIVGRKGSIFKLSTGQKIAPVPIEAALERIPWVDLAQVLGRGRTRPVAIVWIQPHSAPARDVAKEALIRAVSHLDRRLQPGEFVVIPRQARVEEGEITLTQKLRRAANERRYSECFEDSSLTA